MRFHLPAILLPILAVGCTPLASQLQHAPPPRKIDDQLGVPIDIEKLEASVVFDFEEKTSRAVADLWFRAGKVDGVPVFDLRQNIDSARLDGVALDLNALRTHDFGRLTGTMRTVNREMKAGSRHHLHLEYPIDSPLVPKPLPPKFTEDGVQWDTWASDLRPGRYLEQWFPTNLLYDQFAFTLTLQVKGLGEGMAHEVVTNGALEALGQAHWKITFPPHFTAFSPMVVLIPKTLVERSVREVKLKNGQVIQVDVCRPKNIKNPRSSLAKMHAATAKALEDFTTHLGPWPHGDRCTVFEYSGSRSMEYNGATTSSYGALRHELLHSYFGRGLKPASQNGGWWDEAFTVYFLGRLRARQATDRIRQARRRRGSRMAGRVALSPADPWNRVTPGASYSLGAWLFGEVAKVIGEEPLTKAMAGLVQTHALKPISTGQLQAHLEGVAGDKLQEVRDLFEFVVYARQPVVRFTTELGIFEVELQAGAAPITAKNFLRYVDAGLYDGGRFHRSVRKNNQTRADVLIEVVQGGSHPDKGGKGFPAIPLETTRQTGLKHVDGAISMARGKPDSARSDFFLCIGAQPALDFGGARNADGQGFAAFGRVIAGMDVVRKIHQSATEGEKLTPPITIRSAKRVR